MIRPVWRRRVAAALSTASLGAACPAVAAPGGASGTAVPIVVAQVKAGGSLARGEGLLPSPPGEGGRLVLVAPGGRRRVLTAAFHSAADPEVSFDGRSLLFAAKKEAGDPWCVYESALDGTNARRITCGPAGARQPVYQSTVYTITPTNVEPWVQVAFVGENPGEWNEARSAPNTSLWSCRTDGTALRRLTYNLSNDRDPVVLPDGRMVYAGWLRSPEPGGRDRVDLLGVNEDGTDYQLYAGREGLRVKQSPAATAGGLVVFVESADFDGDGGGRLASVRQERPLHSHRALTSEADGLFRAPAALPDGRVLVARRAAAADAPWEIWRFDPGTGARRRVYGERGWHSVQAKPVAPRRVPDARSSVVRDDDPEGRLYTLDASLPADERAPAGGAATRVRVVEGVPATADRAAARRLLGEVDLAEDGSWQAQLPANTPLRLELIDARGEVLRRSAWLWVRNHASQGCVGCHEDPELAPRNRFPKALSSPAPVLNAPVEKRPYLEGDEPGASVSAFVRRLGGEVRP